MGIEKFVLAVGITVAVSSALLTTLAAAEPPTDKAALDTALARALRQEGFTGTIEGSLPSRLGRVLDPKLVELGRHLFFDVDGGLHDDNTCAGCHAPSAGMGDTQSIAIGIQNNFIVGPAREGPRNQRRTPSVINTAFYPSLMWNGRFLAPSGDPFDASRGFVFPAPEGTTAFPPNHPVISHLLIAQAHIPPTELVEVAGFTGTRGTIGERFDVFDDGIGTLVPAPDASGFRNGPIRDELVRRLNAVPYCRERFAEVFLDVAAGAPIDFTMYARAIAEFEFSLTFANAPIDRFARGERTAMSEGQKRGALLFFGKARCVRCHAAGPSVNEMFSDFENHNIGVPQIAPEFGLDRGNVIFDGPGEDEDFGLAQVTGDARDRYKFRTSPLRNVAVQPAFFHNGAFTRLEDAVRHHLDVQASVNGYDPSAAGLDEDLCQRIGPMGEVLKSVDPQLRHRSNLSESEFRDLLEFVRDSLLDPRALPAHLCSLIPQETLSGKPMLLFEDCR